MKRHVQLFLELGKVRISVLSTVSALTGFLIAGGAPGVGLVGLALGVFLLASGAAAINQIQERDIDGLMRRTMGRPLPTRRVSVRYACVISALSLAVGLTAIEIFGGWVALLLGIFTVLWYNAAYTPLKRHTAFAAIPGGLVGAIPPVIGWSAAGGSITNPQILAVALFFFVWQIPHFWLLLLFTCGDDYERAGLPSLTAVFTQAQIARMTFVWIFATAVVCVMIPLFGGASNPIVSAGLFISGLWLVWRAKAILGEPRDLFPFRVAFRQINLYASWVIVLLSVGRLTA